VESRRALRGTAAHTQAQTPVGIGVTDEQQRLVTHLIQTDPVHDTQLGMAQASFMQEAIVPTLLMGGAIFVATGNLGVAIAPFQLDFGSGVPISIATTLRSALMLVVQQGIYIRSGRVLEKLAQVDALVLDANMLLSDELEFPSTRATIATLQTQGISLYLLHDDSASLETITDQATQVGIAADQILVARSAEQQANLIQALQTGGQRIVVMANPDRFKSALTCADVSVVQARSNWTMAEVLHTPLDGVLLDRDWRRVVKGIEIAQRAFERIYQNTAIIIFPNLIVTGAGMLLGLNPVVNIIVNNGSAFVAEFINNKRPLVNLESVMAREVPAVRSTSLELV
jgi:soluble P-type ATPase